MELPLDTGFELEVHDAGPPRRIPLAKARTSVGSPGVRANDVVLEGSPASNRQGLLHVRHGKVFFVSTDPATACEVNGKVTMYCELTPDDTLTIGPCRLRLVHAERYAGTLIGYCEPYLNVSWELGTRDQWLGSAPGAQVHLAHASVAERHLQLAWTDEGFRVGECDPAAVLRINGQPPAAGKRLADGDLLQVGELFLRFRQADSGGGAPVTRHATILFADIWDYSQLFRGRLMSDVVAQMNQLFGRLGRTLEAHGGQVMRYVGDAVLASFSGPRGGDHPRRAVAAAQAILRELAGLNEAWERDGQPALQLGLGLNSGDVVLGELGYSGKLEFSALGAEVNLAARIEKLTRETGERILLGPATAAAVAGAVPLRSLGPQQVKGHWEPLEVFALAVE